MNMGIGDAVDLGWKLAATLQGWGGPRLLDTYGLERKPVHRRVIDAAVESYALVGTELVRDDIEQRGAAGDRARKEVGELVLKHKLPEFRSLGLVLGSHRESPIIVPDGTRPPRAGHRVPAVRSPGMSGPHLWLKDGSSLYDHFGPASPCWPTAGSRSPRLRACGARRRSGACRSQS